MSATPRQKVKIQQLGIPELAKLILPYVPDAAADYAASLWHRYQFSLKVAPPRSTRLGDYTYKNKHHYITVNQDLNPYAWLITYLHEVAHLEVRVRYAHQAVSPHGIEWKQSFQELLHPVARPDVFPLPILQALKKYMADPKASSCSDPHLMRSLKAFDPKEEGDAHKALVEQLKPSELFVFQDKRFRLEAKRRTRYLCTEVASGRQFLFSGLAEVERVQ